MDPGAPSWGVLCTRACMTHSYISKLVFGIGYALFSQFCYKLILVDPVSQFTKVQGVKLLAAKFWNLY